MSTERYQRAKSIFLRVTAAPQPEQAALLDSECGDDQQLRAEVELLMAHDVRTPVGTDAVSAEGIPDPLVGRTVGRYHITALLGRGGFGVVYEAEQSEPVRRTVAVKVIRPGYGSEEVVARFETERQALAMMDHPYIARIFDAGTLEDGRPYFAMELVRGEPITIYCGRHQLDHDARLDLFLLVCDAVRHAHTKGLAHRDLKPSNILVGGEPPTPRVIDFGIAKALQGKITEDTVATVRGLMIGTPAYMSPEQAGVGGVPPDTRSDVYSLGVLLYELLTGVLPFPSDRLQTRDFAKIQQIIGSETPIRPSSRLGDSDPSPTWSGQTSSTLSRRVRGDLDWIVMRCLEKEPSRRYETVDALAADIRRHRRHEPVEACPPSAAYRASKFIRRHRAGTAAASIAALALISAAAISASFALSEATLRRLAEQRERELEDMVSFQSEVIAGLDPAVMGGTLRSEMLDQISRSLTRERANATQGESIQSGLQEVLDRINARDLAAAALSAAVLDSTSDQIRVRFEARPELEGRLRLSLLRAFHQLGNPQLAVEQGAKAVELHQQALGPDDPRTLEAIAAYSQALDSAGRSEEAMEGLHRAYITARDKFGDLHETTIVIGYSYAAALLDGDADEAENVLRPVVASAQQILPLEHPTRVQATSRLIMLLIRTDKLDEAEALAQEHVAQLERAFGTDSDWTILALNSLGSVQRNQGKLVEARASLQRALDRSRARWGSRHPQTLTYMSNLAQVLGQLGQRAEARLLATEAYEGRRDVLGASHPDTADAVLIMAQQASSPVEMEAGNREAVRIYTLAYGHDHPYVLGSLQNVGIALYQQGRLDEAVEILLDVFDRRVQVSGPDHLHTFMAEHDLAYALLLVNRLEEAATHAKQAHAAFTERFGRDDWRTCASEILLSHIALAEGRVDEATATFIAAIGRLAESYGWCHPSNASELGSFVARLNSFARYEEAERVVDFMAEHVLKTESELSGANCIQALSLLYQRISEARGSPSSGAVHERVIRRLSEIAGSPDEP